MTNLALFHRIAGLATVLVFLGTGAYLAATLPEPDQSTHLMRMTYRSAHVYLLLAGLVNLGVGIYLVRAEGGWRRGLQTIGSALLLAAPVLELLAFIYEPPQASLERPLTLSAMVALLSGTLAHLPSRRKD